MANVSLGFGIGLIASVSEATERPRAPSAGDYELEAMPRPARAAQIADISHIGRAVVDTEPLETPQAHNTTSAAVSTNEECASVDKTMPSGCALPYESSGAWSRQESHEQTSVHSLRRILAKLTGSLQVTYGSSRNEPGSPFSTASACVYDL